MARIKISEKTLGRLGFRSEQLGDMTQHIREVSSGWTLEYAEGILELVHKGRAVPLPVRRVRHVEAVINAF